jgi:lysyl-tRNA synthetase, class II
VFSSDRRAFLGYRVSGRTLVVAGDPVGAADSLPALIDELIAEAERHGLSVAIVSAGAANLALYRAAGLRALYIGDEAIVDAAGFSLEGRPIRKVRQSVARLVRAGYQLECRSVQALSTTDMAELDAISALWRAGAPERGFSMALDDLRSDASSEGRVVIGRDADGRARSFLHFVPCPGRPAMSLSAMRRDPETPNGLTEFLLVGAIGALREQGVEELSLNFASFGRLLRAPRGPLERVVRRVVVAADRHFQTESLYRFNAKFFPRWEPRYLVYQGPLGLPRAGIAALRAEGQVPHLPLDALVPRRLVRPFSPAAGAAR